VPRSTRQQRRQRRAQAAGTPPIRPAARPQVAPEEELADRQPAEVERRPAREEPRSGVPGLRFVNEAAAELKKVEWPSQQQVVSGTAVVLVACLIVGVFLWGNDELWRYVVQHVLLR
jgi:preprotein translocase subunit SecE